MSEIKSFFEEKLPAKFSADPSKAESMSGKYLFVIEGDGGGAWSVDFPGGGAMEIAAGECDDAACKIIVQAEDWTGILNGEMDATTAFMTGKLRIEGDMAMAMKLQPILGGA